MKNILNVALLKEKKQFTKKFTTFFTIVKLANFYFISFQLDSPLTSLFYSLLSIYHIKKCKKFCQIFFVFINFKKKKKILGGSCWLIVILYMKQDNQFSL